MKNTGLLKQHHSIADWDWYDAKQRALDNTIYVSPPSSLRISSYDTTWRNNCWLCKYSGTTCIPDGRLVTYLRRHHPTYGRHMLIFRNQKAVGGADWQNCYAIYFIETEIRVVRIEAGAQTVLQIINYTLPINEWHRFRVTFYSGTNPEGTPALNIILEHYQAEEWILFGDVSYDPLDKWADSAVNRLGGLSFTRNTDPNHWDDTEIWKRV